MRPGEPDINRFDFTTRHHFGFADALFYRFRYRVEIDDRTFLDSFRFGFSEADGFQARIANRRNERTNLGRSDVEAYNVFFFSSHTML